jgi:dUTP pyrophosphatase
MNNKFIPLLPKIEENKASTLTMILPGSLAAARNIVQLIRNPRIQIQPCGIDLTLKRILIWKGAGTVDFDNKHRENATTEELSFQNNLADVSEPELVELKSIHLPLGSFLVEFNETVDMPLDTMGQIFVRSSLFRSGALLHAGVMDSGYRGTIGSLLQVVNPQGLRLFEHARLAQMVFHTLSEPTEGYSGVYQGRQAM